MNKRTHGAKVAAEHKRRGLSGSQIRAQKCQKTKLRNEERRKARRQKAAERQKEWSDLSVEEKIQSLNRRLGKGQGAKKQRARLTES